MMPRNRCASADYSSTMAPLHSLAFFVLAASTVIYAAPPLFFPSSSGPPVVNSYSPDFGTFIGRLQAPSFSSSPPNSANLSVVTISGFVYAVNESAIQIVNFTYDGRTPDTFFWLDRGPRPSRDGIRLSTLEYGLSPLGMYPPARELADFGVAPSDIALPRLHAGGKQQKVSASLKKGNIKMTTGDKSVGGSRVVLALPDDVKLSSFRSFSLFTLSADGGGDDHSRATVAIPENLVVPRTQLLYDELRGQRYGLSSGVIQLLDARTVKIFGFMFQGDKAPDGYFYVGRGLNVSKEAGVRAVIRGRDTAEFITPMSERYTGGNDIFVELPEGYTIHSIDWISVYCLRYEIDFGHVFLKNVSRTADVSQMSRHWTMKSPFPTLSHLLVPPFVPHQKNFEEDLDAIPVRKRWNVTNLVGISKSQLNFTFQLGPAAGSLGYKSLAFVARAPRYVWYVNGYMAADLYLKRGVNYTFIVEGGRNASGLPHFFNPLYLSNSSYGGYAKLSNSERQHVRKYLPRESMGRLCRWEEDERMPDPDEFSTFVDYRDWLKLECESGGAENGHEQLSSPLLWFVPDRDTPELIYYGSYTNYQMGGRIFVVDEFPADLEHVVSEAFRFDSNAHQAKLQQELAKHERNSATPSLTPTRRILISIFAATLLALFITNGSRRKSRLR